jgi:uncharacterized protein
MQHLANSNHPQTNHPQTDNTLTLVRQASYLPKPWANGSGVTREIAISKIEPNSSAGAWDWRLSLATIDVDGPFSHLPGVARALVVATGRGMRIVVDDKPRDLNQFETIEFSGESTVYASLLEDQVQDLNLMTRLGRPLFEIMHLDADTTLEILPNTVGIVVLSGSLGLRSVMAETTETTVAPLDTVLVSAALAPTHDQSVLRAIPTSVVAVAQIWAT